MLARWADNAMRDARNLTAQGEPALANLAHLRAEVYISAAELIAAEGITTVVGSYQHRAATLAGQLHELEILGAPVEVLALPYIVGRAHQHVAAALGDDFVGYIPRWV
ncbi:hypothetical protein GCM10012275_31250 [Longimycelium tulufanense]|uniref:Uncharacterized protein n=2 Tax=Longimycelium tulufanense TaxID=907463 RepID=A0A8J3C913_9PSEU|nr:hypothetical protein GCM10012275_31250 [Longimycelium tulufanense]